MLYVRAEVNIEQLMTNGAELTDDSPEPGVVLVRCRWLGLWIDRRELSRLVFATWRGARRGRRC